ncbi:hypothetical protein NPA31_007325 [Aurantimonas sp. MSK8Z-1]|uniref:hypothetical protein n=1 Tax=Mangrovibrevibacter kandeliae TaxID=2968473 RepID=UPI0021176B02|nr:hypothetical protein [Aurantimonas sp. MSK8Z-1]MCW4114773.1 hypothetical protein [Aurantimonas sp. MSK8Z-1]
MLSLIQTDGASSSRRVGTTGRGGDGPASGPPSGAATACAPGRGGEGPASAASASSLTLHRIADGGGEPGTVEDRMRLYAEAMTVDWLPADTDADPFTPRRQVQDGGAVLWLAVTAAACLFVLGVVLGASFGWIFAVTDRHALVSATSLTGRLSNGD